MGFKFSNPRRLGSEITAVKSDAVYGDSFTLGSEMIEKIGNNVSVVFKDVDFKDGATVMEITGRTRNQKDRIRLSVSGMDDLNVEFDGTDEVVTNRYDIPEIKGVHELTAVFLPGTDFDFKSIKFTKG